MVEAFPTGKVSFFVPFGIFINFPERKKENAKTVLKENFIFYNNSHFLRSILQNSFPQTASFTIAKGR